ncbi:hypothetical protein [Nonomuraea sp. NPDC050783]|uniref:hypothetical protein n=1 Tax=Nonomuraea sp. NPDC050783 TaxID=3154634 RepID=UPI00346561B0
MMPVLRRNLAATAEAAETARTWIRTAISAGHPRISVTDAAYITAEMVTAALVHTPEGGLIEVHLFPARSGGLVIKVTDPNVPVGPHPGDWARISCIARNFGAGATAEGSHVMWCELPEVPSP